MENFSRVISVGRATADPVRRGRGRYETVSFGFVVNDREWIRDQWVERPMYIDVESTGPLAADVYRDVRRGFLMLIEGSLRYDQWTDAENKRHAKHKLVLSSYQIQSRPAARPEISAKTSEPESVADDAEPEPI